MKSDDFGELSSPAAVFSWLLYHRHHTWQKDVQRTDEEKTAERTLNVR